MNITKELDNMLEKFPIHRARIIELYQVSANFRMLCEDYWISIQALTTYRKNLQPDSMLAKEYVSICSELEKEVMGYLKDTTA